MGIIIMASGCFPSKKTTEIFSPDGKERLEVGLISVWGLPLPGPEPPDKIYKSAYIKGYTIDNEKIFSFDLNGQLNRFRDPLSTCDVQWSNDSKFFAVKSHVDLNIYDSSGNTNWKLKLKRNEKPASIRWKKNVQELIAIIKSYESDNGIGDPIDSIGFRVLSINPYDKVEKRVYSVETKPVSYIYSTLGEDEHEISPDATYFIFSDGDKVHLLNLETHSVENDFAAKGNLINIRWIDNWTVLLEFLVKIERDPLKKYSIAAPDYDERFFLYKLREKSLEDCTSEITKYSRVERFSKGWYKKFFESKRKLGEIK